MLRPPRETKELLAARSYFARKMFVVQASPRSNPAKEPFASAAPCLREKPMHVRRPCSSPSLSHLGG